MKNRKGFTLIELLVVIGIIAMLVSILLPALSRAKELTKRIKDSAQMRGVGNAIVLYQNDFRGNNPRVPTHTNRQTYKYFGNEEYRAITAANLYDRWTINRANDYSYNSDVPPTVGGSMYLLVKYEDVHPDAFLCPSSMTDVPMDWERAVEAANNASNTIRNWTNCHDWPSRYNFSYSYNDPWFRPLDDSSSSASPVIADKNPIYDFNGGENRHVNTGITAPDPDDTDNPVWTEEGTTTANGWGNSNNHETECQMVLYMDAHVTKCETPTVGITKDNIYTFWVNPANPSILDKKIGRWNTTSPETMYDPAGGVPYNGSHNADAYLGN